MSGVGKAGGGALPYGAVSLPPPKPVSVVRETLRGSGAWMGRLAGGLRDVLIGGGLRDVLTAGGLRDALIPQTCVGCGAWIAGAGGALVCPTCDAEIRAAAARSYCRRCGRTLPATAIHDDGCARCRTERHWNLAGLARVATYVTPLRSAVLGLKFAGQRRNAEYLATLLAEALGHERWCKDVQALVPVPMHYLRRLQRHFPHAAVLTEALARKLDLPVWRVVKRVQHGRSQLEITTKYGRLDNIRGHFAAARRHTKLDGATVCIVDNLVMSGGTICEVAKVVRQLGARRIYGAAAARPAAPGDPFAGDPSVVGDLHAEVPPAG